jgi:hypothetical protein
VIHWKGTENNHGCWKKKLRWIVHEVFLFLMEKSIYYRSTISTLHNWEVHIWRL